LSDRDPTVTVVVPARNEADGIGRAIESLLAQEYPRDCFQVVVVDNASTDQTGAVARALAVRVLDEPVPSSYRARNRAVTATSSEFLAFMDADCAADPRWLRALVDAAAAERSGYVAGRIENVIAAGAPLGARLLAARTSADSRRRDVLADAAVAAGNVLIARRVFEEHGLFAPARSGSDVEFSRRVAAAGERIGYAQDAVVYHRCDESNGSYLRRSFRVAYGQSLHRGDGVWTAVSRVPWRPGLGRARRLAPVLGLGGPSRLAALCAYLWMERACDYVGRLAGSLARSARGTGPRQGRQ
jgi:glycosyltransferase involved in cell wall biosynthesis